MPVPHDDPLDHDPTELLAARSRGHGDRVGQCEDAGPAGVEGEDPVSVRQLAEGDPRRVPFGLVVQVAPGVLLLQLLEAGAEP